MRAYRSRRASLKLLAVGVALVAVLESGLAPGLVASGHAIRAGQQARALHQTPPNAARDFVSIRLAAIGSSVSSPRGPFRVRPRKLSFDLGGYYGAGSKGLWISDLRWTDWGHAVAFASGMVHARVWPTKKFIVVAGGIMLDRLESCTGRRSYYTDADMVVPAGFPQNTESTAYGISEQALAPC